MVYIYNIILNNYVKNKNKKKKKKGNYQKQADNKN